MVDVNERSDWPGLCGLGPGARSLLGEIGGSA